VQIAGASHVDALNELYPHELQTELEKSIKVAQEKELEVLRAEVEKKVDCHSPALLAPFS
jgi:hypothetical protein